eukprot:979260_1
MWLIGVSYRRLRHDALPHDHTRIDTPAPDSGAVHADVGQRVAEGRGHRGLVVDGLEDRCRRRRAVVQDVCALAPLAVIEPSGRLVGHQALPVEGSRVGLRSTEGEAVQTLESDDVTEPSRLHSWYAVGETGGGTIAKQSFTRRLKHVPGPLHRQWGPSHTSSVFRTQTAVRKHVSQAAVVGDVSAQRDRRDVRKRVGGGREGRRAVVRNGRTHSRKGQVQPPN